MARARWSALLTEATDVSSSSATSLACQASTSRRISTARCRAGRCCSAATKASRTLSLAAVSSAGSAVVGSTRSSGIGPTHSWSARFVSVNDSTRDAGPRSTGRARRFWLRSMSRQTLVAIR